MARIIDKSNDPRANDSAQDPGQETSLSSVEEMILRMRFGLSKLSSKDSLDRNVSDELRKKLQFLELKAFEQSGRIKELLSDIEKKKQKR